MVLNQHKLYRLYLAPLYFVGAAITFLPQQGALAQSVDNTSEETRHIHVPFVHIDIKKHSNGKKDVDVKAPFTRVHNPTGDNNAQVKAPFYKSDHEPKTAVSNTRVPAAQ